MLPPAELKVSDVTQETLRFFGNNAETRENKSMPRTTRRHSCHLSECDMQIPSIFGQG